MSTIDNQNLDAYIYQKTAINDRVRQGMKQNKTDIHRTRHKGTTIWECIWSMELILTYGRLIWVENCGSDAKNNRRFCQRWYESWSSTSVMALTGPTIAEDWSNVAPCSRSNSVTMVFLPFLLLKALRRMKHIRKHRPCSALLPRPGRGQSEVLTNGIMAYPARWYQFHPIVYGELICMTGELFHRRMPRGCTPRVIEIDLPVNLVQ